MTTTIDDDSLVTQPTTVTNADSPYVTSGEQYIYADTSTGSITITLASGDTEDGREIRVIDTGTNASTNNITINTEGGESINPGGNSSITLTVDGTYVDLFSDGSNWFSDRASEKQSVSTVEIDVGKLLSSLDAAGYDLTNVGKVTTNTVENPSASQVFTQTNSVNLAVGSTVRAQDQETIDSGLLSVTVNEGNGVAVFAAAVTADPTLITAAQNGSLFSTTAGNSGTVNVFTDSNNLTQIENQTSQEKNIKWNFVSLGP
jgi:hypothetical protein